MNIYPNQPETAEVTATIEQQLKNVQDMLKSIPQIKLGYKTEATGAGVCHVKSSTEAVDALRASWDENSIEFVEHFKVMLLNRGNRILGICEISTGGISGTVADPKLVLSAALLTASSGIILCHNHPSGTLKASEADRILTRKIKDACKVMDIVLLDHVILTKEGHYSFADEGEV